MSICSVMVVVTRQGKLSNVGGKWDLEEKLSCVTMVRAQH